ncbi:MAG: hypothetical protein ABJF01_23495 [bacterium]
MPLSPAPKSIANGWWPMYDDATLLAWKRSGEAVSLGRGSEVLALHIAEAMVRVHRVTTLDEYMATVSAYRAFAERSSFSTETFDHTLTCLFRGQSRDYIDGGVLVSWPTAFRTRQLTDEYLSLERDTPLAQDWGRWASVIAKVNDVEDESGDLYAFSDPLQPERRTAPPLADRTLSGRLTTNLELMALGMHYGFPTASLDVTPDESLALWFALNVGRTDAGGRICYEPNSGAAGAEEGPSVYVYIQRRSLENPVVDLTAGALTRERASRPFVQRAWALPFHVHASQLGGGMDAGFGRITTPAQRWPSAVIKPMFSPDAAANARSMYSAAELFPSNDTLYRALGDADVPRLARYAE